MKFVSFLIGILAFSLFSNTVVSQDSAAKAAFQWTVKSKKLAPGQYELTFSTPGTTGTQLYAPAQDLDGTASAELSFTYPDMVVESFAATGDTKTINPSFFGNKPLNITEGPAEWKAIVKFSKTVPASLLGNLSVYYNKGDEFLPDIPVSFNTTLEGGVSSGGKIRIASIDIKSPVNSCGDEATQDKSLAGIFLLGFLGGLIALITPCVFPMIPVTVTFFTKKSKNKKGALFNAAMYGFFIFLIYVAITIPFHIAGETISPEIFNNISTNVWLNLIFFAVFVAFALSFFGLYEIILPSSFANKTDSRSGHKNISGIFFMAATLAIVSFSCTGPILGTLLANVANEGPWPLTMGAAGFGLALGLPFALFALFPNWLHSLPKSGGWMTDVKVVLGFIELALAVKFLANADNVEQWGILKREVFIGAWVIIGIAIVLYLLGWLKLGHGTRFRKFSSLRISFILFFTLFTAYLVPGLTNSTYANLSLLSGFPPPLSYSVYKHHVLIARGIEPIHNDYEKALARARAEKKPLLIDFTGWACVNCRRMEEKVWTNREVDSLMRDRFVVVSLYVDERKNLPATEQTVFRSDGGNEKNIVTVGDKWSTFQTENFGATSQPQYAIISPDEKALTKTKFYTPDPLEFSDWLKCGLKAMSGEK
ncbi:MAG: thioredoxin family protein [Chitinophagaceae bacterium]|nr:thioredoxin family protein [Chitinophagaceae bacterium]